MRIPFRKPGKFQSQKTDPLLTEGKFEALERELHRLEGLRPGLAAEVARLAELGDFSENVEYQMAKGRLRGLNQRMLVLEHQLSGAQIIPTPKQTTRIAIGHTITVEIAGKQKVFQILGSEETDPGAGIISHTSPIGAALLNHKVGDVVKIPLANRDVEYRIVGIE